MTIPRYQYREEEEIENIEDEDLDDFVDVVNAIRAKTRSGKYIQRDLSNRADRGSFTGTNVGGLKELSDHTTTAVKGISPRLSYRSNTNTKGPAFGVQTPATYIRDRPGRISGTQYGTSRAPMPIVDDDETSIFSISDLSDPMERSFIKHQKRVNRIKNMINSLEES
tara:strand:- start:104 stop:604 length:501 start_codon:yes stop_codon:yes gene_type:complete